MYVSTQSNKCPEYLTKGKKYKAKAVMHEGKKYFVINDDDGDKTYILPVGCTHIGGGNWTLYPNHKTTLWQRVKSAIGC